MSGTWLWKGLEDLVSLSHTPSPIGRRIEEGCALVPPRQFIWDLRKVVKMDSRMELGHFANVIVAVLAALAKLPLVPLLA